MMLPTMPTVQHWAEQAAQTMDHAGLYFGHGTDNAWDEACWMVAHVLQWPPDFSSSRLAETLSEAQLTTLGTLLDARVKTRKPLAYLTGQAWFAGLCFAVSEDVLVPRSPMAELIVDGLSPWVNADQPLRVLDVGTGCGCLALATAYYWSKAEVMGIDVSKKALQMAQNNALALGLADRVQWVVSDVYDAIADETFDVILSNPPYVPESSMASLPREYQHEPSLGLVAGQQGLDIVQRLVLQAKDHLTPQGVLVCEVGEAAEAWDRWCLERQLEMTWLTFSQGGDGVFLVTSEALSGLDA